jgi:hypothetical protein
VRIVVLVVLLSRVAAADSNTLTLEGNAMASIFALTESGSLHYEHRFDNDAWTGRIAAGIAEGFFLEEDDVPTIPLFGAFVGYRHYWGPHFYGEVEAGVGAVRQPRRIVGDDLDDGPKHSVGIKWTALPDSQMTLGGKFGPVDIGVFTSIPFIGIGVQVGVDFARW